MDTHDRKDGVTEAQLANARAIYEDPHAYAEWRVRMGLEKPPEVRTTSVMRQRVVGLFADLTRKLEQDHANRPRDPWERAPARKLTPEELADLYGRSPVTVSDALRRSNHDHSQDAA
jgi:hypothetical protein